MSLQPGVHWTISPMCRVLYYIAEIHDYVPDFTLGTDLDWHQMDRTEGGFIT